MRIVIDLQGAQSTGNRNRGIGRYTLSLVQAIVRNRGEHEILIALNGLFPETIESIRTAFRGFLPQENIRVWYAVAPVNELDSNNVWRREAAEYIRETFLASLQPDFVIVSSLFEGLRDDAITSIGKVSSVVPTATILYDLIPFIHRKPYLENPNVEKWYLKKINYLQRSDLLFAISESSRQEGISHVGFPEERIVNISSAVNDHFIVTNISVEDEAKLREKYGLYRPFLMYTGGIDHRKNIEGLIRAYALVSKEIRQTHQLAIVCSASIQDCQGMAHLAREQGLNKGEIVFTGFVPEEDLIALYNLCNAFVFPSWHEGFGLPVLEAMRCGAAAIGSNTSSVPEVIDNQEALFDPYSDADIAEKITQILTDEDFRKRLISHNSDQVKKFSWDLSAQRAITAFENYYNEKNKQSICHTTTLRRTKLAYLSPLPPEKSGIADYSAELLPELSKYYEIDVVIEQQSVSDPWIQANCPIRSVEWFKAYADQYDRVLYHFGNSHFHQHMFSLLEQIPGITVLHDFYLSGIVAYMDFTNYAPGIFSKELYNAHGYPGINDRLNTSDSSEIIFKYPCNLNVLQNSLGVVVHSEYSRQLAEQWYGKGASKDWSVIPLLRVPANNLNRTSMREKLGFKESDFIICSFGILAPTKLNDRLLSAFLSSALANDSKCKLVFVGASQIEYGQKLLRTIKQSIAKDRIYITGWVDTNEYRQYLAATDVAVQLRTLSRGETSGTVLDCMNYGLPTIVNANGSMRELPEDSVYMLPDEFSDAELIDALETFYRDIHKWNEIGKKAKSYIRDYRSPKEMAKQYKNAIEKIYSIPQQDTLIKEIAKIENVPEDDNTLFSLANSIAQSLSVRTAQRQLLVDISEIVRIDAKSDIQRVVRAQLQELIKNPPKGYRVEPVYLTNSNGNWVYRYARDYTLNLIGAPNSCLTDSPVEVCSGDIFYGFDLSPSVTQASLAGIYSSWRNQGGEINFLVDDLLPILRPDCFPTQCS